jgi:hypothetical protein
MQAQIKGLNNQRCVCGCRSADENCFGARVLHTFLRVRKVLYGWWQVLRSPFVSAGLCIADSNKFDPGLLEGEDARAKGSQSAQAEKCEFGAAVSG